MNPLLLLHGALGSKSQLDPLKSILETKGFDVYSFNFSGHNGKGFRDPFGIETFAGDIHSFMRDKYLKRADIFGYSMGGYVALWFAHHYPELVGKIVTLGTKFDWSPAAAEREVKKLDPDKILEKVPSFARILERRHHPNDWRDLLHKTSAMMMSLGDKPLITPDILSKIKNEIIILLGDLDDMADRNYSQHVSELLPNGKFLLLKHTPHPIERVDVKTLSDILFLKAVS